MALETPRFWLSNTPTLGQKTLHFANDASGKLRLDVTLKSQTILSGLPHLHYHFLPPFVLQGREPPFGGGLTFLQIIRALEL